MPIKKEREYRALAAPLTAQSATKLIQTEYYVEGYATTFDTPYLLYEFEDGTKIYERIDAHALDGADMSDVIMQYDHEGRVFARQSNNTLILEPDVKGLFVAADLSRTDLARGLYQDISAGMITKMSWAFTVAEESYDRETHTRTILKAPVFILDRYNKSGVFHRYIRCQTLYKFCCIHEVVGFMLQCLFQRLKGAALYLRL